MSTPIPARLVAEVPTPFAPGTADAPFVLHSGGRRRVVQRGDARLAVLDVESGDIRSFPTPWPRTFGTVTLSPNGDLAVFSGLHAVRAVDASGATRWEVRHGCWSARECTLVHDSFAEYANDEGHDYADSGSAAFRADGKLVWAHVRQAQAWADEEWLVLDALDGTVLGRAGTGTVGSGSFSSPHPHGPYMGLSVGEGDEDSPALWGHWDGTRLTFERIDGVLIQDVSPSGHDFLCTDPGQWALYLHAAADGAETNRLDAVDAVPPAPGEDTVEWDYEGAYPYEDGAVVGTEGDCETPRHWLVDPRTMSLRGRIAYPAPVFGSPRPAGPGVWWTAADEGRAVRLWTLGAEH
ncbi:hypothetical protein G6045_21175 [Streptomyces sp. YC504]|uniref:WD40 repeat domain-containing protein n=1 Tax=Streptomyces mesophilus TaxID=1775132 RepID=A0A6G4XL58_9ACTN|nr:hypothetical protein [Streptomyces mesophilus]NGO78158.1 hypothetical protein [Streptomyces mesophilus]